MEVQSLFLEKSRKDFWLEHTDLFTVDFYRKATSEEFFCIFRSSVYLLEKIAFYSILLVIWKQACQSWCQAHELWILRAIIQIYLEIIRWGTARIEQTAWK